MVTDESKTEEQTTAEPEWFGEAMSLHEQGVDADAIAAATGKAVSTVRKLIRRKTEAAEAEAQAARAADPESPAEDSAAAQAELDAAPSIVDAETAARLAASAGDSGGDPDPEPAELFPVGSIDGDGFTFKAIGNAKNPVTEITVAMTGGEVPIPKGSGLLDPAKEGMLLVTYEVADAGRLIPQREGDRGEKTIVGYKARQTVRPIFIERVKGEEGVIEGHFAALLEADQGRAGALLDRLNARAGRRLSE